MTTATALSQAPVPDAMAQPLCIWRPQTASSGNGASDADALDAFVRLCCGARGFSVDQALGIWHYNAGDAARSLADAERYLPLPGARQLLRMLRRCRTRACLSHGGALSIRPPPPPPSLPTTTTTTIPSSAGDVVQICGPSTIACGSTTPFGCTARTSKPFREPFVAPCCCRRCCHGATMMKRAATPSALTPRPPPAAAAFANARAGELLLRMEAHAARRP